MNEDFKEKCETCKFDHTTSQFMGMYGMSKAFQDVSECRLAGMSDEEIRDEGLDPTKQDALWNDEKSDTYGVDIPCPCWKEKEVTCKKHGHFTGTDTCPRCEEEFEKKMEEQEEAARKLQELDL